MYNDIKKGLFIMMLCSLELTGFKYLQQYICKLYLHI